MHAAILLSLMSLQAPALAVNIVGRVHMRLGDVTTPLTRFAEVPESATVITGPGGLATLRLASGSVLRLGADTEVALDRLAHGTPAGERREAFSIKVGRVWAGVLKLLGTDSRFEVSTANAVAGVCGILFWVEVLV